MDIRFLSTLTTVNTGSKADYTIVKNQNDDFRSFIMDTANFKNADSNHDDFLTYTELANIKLSPIYNAQKNLFELHKGIYLLNSKSVNKILDNSGLSLKLLEENFKELDKNKDNKITSNEISPELTKIADTNQRDYKAFKMQKLTQKMTKNQQKSNQSKEIEALDKQIASLRKMLHSLKTQQIVAPVAANKNDAKNISTTNIDKKLAINGLKNKYGEKDANKLISTISRTPNATKHISSIMYQSGTKASDKEVAALAGLMLDASLNKVAVKEMSDMNAIEQLSPANTPVNIVENNIDLSISNIESKIQDLEGMKGEILEREAEKTAEDIYH